MLESTTSIVTRATLANAAISCPQVSVCLSVCLSVRLSQVGVLLKRLNVGSRKQRHTIADRLWFSDAENLGKTQTKLECGPMPNVMVALCSTPQSLADAHY